MEWQKITVHTRTEGLDFVTAALMDAGIHGVEIVDHSDLQQFLTDHPLQWDYVDESLLSCQQTEAAVICYIPTDPSGQEQFLSIKDSLHHLQHQSLPFSLGSLSLDCHTVDDASWLNKWKEYYKPFPIGEKLFICPVWEESLPDSHRIICRIDPGQVFGTGLHQSTKLCAQALEKYINNTSNVLDLGCGSGILSVMALLLGAASADAVDIDPYAVDTAYQNARINHVDMSKYNVWAGNVLSEEKARENLRPPYNIVVANIVAGIIIEMAPLVKKWITENGIFISSGIIVERAEEVKLVLINTGFEILEENRMDNWVSLVVKG